MKEVDLAAKVVGWLEAQGWDVYQEVQPQTFGCTADIVALNGKRLWVIECKTTLSLALLEQAYKWRGYAHMISIATPRTRRRVRGEEAARMFLRQAGIGKITVADKEQDPVTPDYFARPKYMRRIHGALRDALNDQHKTWAKAGNAERHRWTPFQQTCLNLQRIVLDRPGIIFKDAMSALDHHYASQAGAKASISGYLHKGNIIKGVKCERDGRYLRLYPTKEER